MRRILFSAIALAAGSLLGACAFAAPDAFGCPDEIETDDTPGGLTYAFKFRYVSFFNGDPAELADLAPDEGEGPGLDQVWRFEKIRPRPITMVCRYHKTNLTVEKVVPVSISSCSIRSEFDEKGEIIGTPTLACE